MTDATTLDNLNYWVPSGTITTRPSWPPPPTDRELERVDECIWFYWTLLEKWDQMTIDDEHLLIGEGDWIYDVLGFVEPDMDEWCKL